ncbi:hypothetical protein BEP19_14855 [Ammoniphilus oxalaticus]|uniref:Uncharacterized protein n=1 Tax=Ammoniphilus oxalaticus TaxID=66863 RepID=A0A419SDJ8_9BACL|nr:minor capsid protein [Ammoniphilus oxalaticus]RKD20963.1 hypothetical protein BEP19_14855 [Ammoniphilus oxalaticus]
MRAQELIDYLIDLGFSVFPDPNFIPSEIKDDLLPALFVFGTGGFSPDDDLPIDNPTFQIIVKGKSYKADPAQMDLTEQLAKQLISHFDKRNNFVIGSSYVYASSPMQSNPIHIGLDEQDRPIYSTNFTFKVRG